MKLIRVINGLSLGLILLASTGCGQKSVVVPTDEEARKRAAADPGQPKAFGGDPGAKQPAGDSPLKTVGIPGPGGETKK
jgi:hypothetical protein